MFRILTILAGLSLSLPTQASETPVLNINILNHSVAQNAVNTAVVECEKRGYKVSAAITSRDGNLLAFVRHPLAGPHTINTSQKKAYTAASLQAPTGKELQKQRSDLNYAPGIVLIQGALPVSVGGIAVAGADPAIDEACAKAGLDALTTTLEFGD